MRLVADVRPSETLGGRLWLCGGETEEEREDVILSIILALYPLSFNAPSSSFESAAALDMSLDTQVALARQTARGESSHLSRAARQIVPPFLQKLYESVSFHRLLSFSSPLTCYPAH